MAIFSSWIVPASPKCFCLLIWVTGCSVLFWRTYKYYQYEPSFYYVHQILGSCLCISRGSAAVLNLNCGLALLPVCRSMITALRYCNTKMKLRTMSGLLDGCKGFHITCAYVIIGLSVVHFIAHLVNAHNFSTYYNSVYRDVNAAQYPDQDPLWIILETVPGVTGFLMMICLYLIFTSSVSYIRKNNYDLFWYCHRLFVIFYILLLIHPLRGPIRKQINLKSHTPGCPYKNMTSAKGTFRPELEPLPEAEYNFDETSVCEDEPRFDGIGCHSWLWVGGPLLIYLSDTLCRIRRRHPPVRIMAVIEHPCDVVEIQLQRDGFSAKVGQFVLLQCLDISVFEWHPYSLTMCPTTNRPTFSVHVRSRGDWSGKLKSKLLKTCRFSDSDEEGIGKREQLSLRVDGPFCSPLEDMMMYKVLVCIAGGIGVTPFTALLNAIRDRQQWTHTLDRVYVIWVCREIQSFSWFTELISEVYKQCWENNRPDLLDIQLYHTDETSANKNLNGEFINRRLHIGRPKWKDILRDLKYIHTGQDIGVFTCGPPSLVSDIRHWSSQHDRPPTMHFYHESY